MNLPSMTSPSTRSLIAIAAVALTSLQALGLAQMAAPDTPTVMLDRVQIVAQREALGSVDVAQLAAPACSGARC